MEIRTSHDRILRILAGVPKSGPWRDIHSPRWDRARTVLVIGWLQAMVTP